MPKHVSWPSNLHLKVTKTWLNGAKRNDLGELCYCEFLYK